MTHGYYNGKSSDKYKYVGTVFDFKNKKVYYGTVLGKSKTFNNEHDAAKWVDITLIEAGKNPVNVLIRK